MGRLPATLATLAAVAVAGCGDDPSRNVDTAQVRSVVHQFAEADGPEACRLMSPKGLQNVYGSFTKPVAVSRQNCIDRSSKFKGERVTIESLKVVDSETVRVGALNPNKTVSYNLSLRKFGPSWRIDDISQSKAEE